MKHNSQTNYGGMPVGNFSHSQSFSSKVNQHQKEESNQQKKEIKTHMQVDSGGWRKYHTGGYQGL